MMGYLKYMTLIIVPVAALAACSRPFESFNLTREFEKFDQAGFERLKNKSQWSFNFHDFLSDSNGNAIQYGETYDPRDGRYYYIISRDSPLIVLEKNFYSNGNIESKGWRHSLGPQIGIWYEFDEDGRLVSETDHDALCDFTMDDVLEYCRTHGIRLAESHMDMIGQEIYATGIWREISHDGYLWNIRYYNNTDYTEDTDESYRFGASETIVLDGKTGKLIGREAMPFHPPDLLPGDKPEDIDVWQQWFK